MSEDCPHCVFEKTEANCRGCFEGSHYKPKPITNADRIRAMTDEELAKAFYTGCESRAYNDNCLVTQELIARGDLAISDAEQDEICLKCWLTWLKSPVEVDDGN